MQIMGIKVSGRVIGWNIAGFFWSIFMGIMAISIGFGSVLHPLNGVAAPFVCPNGRMTVTETVSNPIPTTTFTQVTWYCVDSKTGARTELDPFTIAAFSGPIYGLVIFLCILLIESVYTMRNGTAWLSSSGGSTTDWKATLDAPPPSSDYVPETAASARRARKAQAQHAQVARDAQVRLQKLKDLRASNLITDAEYQQKRAEILAEM